MARANVSGPADRIRLSPARAICGRIGCVGVVVRAGLRPVTARDYERSMAGSSGVSHRPIAVMSLAGWQVAARMARHVMQRAQVARGVLAPLLLRGSRACQRTVAGPWQDCA